MYIILNILTVTISYIFTLKYQNSYPVFHFSVPASSILIIRYFQVLNNKRNNLIYFSYLLIVIAFIFDLALNGVWQNNFITTLTSNILFTIFSYRRLVLILKRNFEINMISIEAEFYILFALLILNATSFFFSILETEIRDDKGDFFGFSISFLLLINILFNIFLSIGIWKQNKDFS
jgi:hypothetical protein